MRSLLQEGKLLLYRDKERIIRSGEGGVGHARRASFEACWQRVREELDLDGGGVRVAGCCPGRRKDLSLVGTMAFVGFFLAVMAAIVTVVVIWSGAYDETRRLGGHDYPGSPPDRGGWDDVEKWTGH
jgi:hypothetical protein